MDTAKRAPCPGCNKRNGHHSAACGSPNRHRSPTRSVADRLDARVDRSAGPDSCWLWTGPVRHDGYGSFLIGGGRSSPRFGIAHRMAWEATRGPIPSGMLDCDVRLCCNPAHLFLGTHSDNMRDMYAKGRANVVRGSAQRNAKLTDESVRAALEAFALGASVASLARRFSVGTTTMRKVVKRIRWTHVHAGVAQ